MFTLFTYKTPPKFADDFKKFYSITNLKQIKVLSMTLLIIAVLARLVSFISYKDVVKIANYSEHALANWLHISGATLFLIISKWAIKNPQLSYKTKKLITLFFIIFLLLVSFGVSYVVSLHNTKNTLTMFLIGIVTVSLFFSLEYKEIIFIAIFIVFVFIASMVWPKITFQEKMMNFLAGIILGMILVAFSRYSYYFKAQHFVRLKQLEEKTLEIERLNNQKSDILAFVAHDLRSPLNNIEMLGGFLADEKIGGGEVEMIVKASKHAKAIIDDLIEVVRTEQPILITTETEISNYIKPIIEKWRLNSARKIVLTTSQETYVKINYSKLERVIDNLISNALKFSDADKPIEVELLKRSQHLCIIVTDYGIGIPVAMQASVFNQFSKFGRTGLKGEKSLGLGLHISKKIVEQHGGKLLIKSEENKGTTFTILLPLV
ncbi:MAG: HAMP domain-containing histidine kinase [Pedobacter sp.]|nr:MAG: HAMP domain-containing histidine kinase [Pedobacter sp.]